MRRVPALSDDDTGIDREVGSHFDTIKIVSDNIDAILSVLANSEYTLKYLGAAETPPSERQDNTPIKDGDYFFDTVQNFLVYYDLSEDIWYDIDPVAVKTYSEAAQAAQVVSEAAQEAAVTESNKAKVEADKAKVEADKAIAAAASVTVKEAPHNDKQYARKNSDWVEVVSSSGMDVDTSGYTPPAGVTVELHTNHDFTSGNTDWEWWSVTSNTITVSAPGRDYLNNTSNNPLNVSNGDVVTLEVLVTDWTTSGSSIMGLYATGSSVPTPTDITPSNGVHTLTVTVTDAANFQPRMTYGFEGSVTLDYFSAKTTAAGSSDSVFVRYNPDGDSYDVVDGVLEAPRDGVEYVRKDGTWLKASNTNIDTVPTFEAANEGSLEEGNTVYNNDADGFYGYAWTSPITTKTLIEVDWSAYNNTNGIYIGVNDGGDTGNDGTTDEPANATVRIFQNNGDVTTYNGADSTGWTNQPSMDNNTLNAFLVDPVAQTVEWFVNGEYIGIIDTSAWTTDIRVFVSSGHTGWSGYTKIRINESRDGHTYNGHIVTNRMQDATDAELNFTGAPHSWVQGSFTLSGRAMWDSAENNYLVHAEPASSGTSIIAELDSMNGTVMNMIVDSGNPIKTVLTVIDEGSNLYRRLSWIGMVELATTLDLVYEKTPLVEGDAWVYDGIGFKPKPVVPTVVVTEFPATPDANTLYIKVV